MEDHLYFGGRYCTDRSTLCVLLAKFSGSACYVLLRNYETM